MSNYPSGIGMADIPGFRNADVAAQLDREAFEENYSSPEMVAFVAGYLTDYMLDGIGYASDWFRAESLAKHEEIAQRMLDRNLDEFAALAVVGEEYYAMIARIDMENAAKKRGAA